MPLEKKIKQILYKIKPDENLWVIMPDEKTGFVSVGIKYQKAKRHLCWVSDKQDLSFLLTFLFIELYLAKILKVVCYLNPKK